MLLSGASNTLYRLAPCWLPLTSSSLSPHFTRFQPSGSQSVVPETPASASFGIVQNPDYHPRSTDLETEGEGRPSLLQQTLLGFLNMPESADHCSVPTLRWGPYLCALRSLGFLLLTAFEPGFLFLECSPHGPLYGNSFLFRSQPTISGSEESSKPSTLSILSPIYLFWPICKNHLPHSEIYLLFVYLLINYFFSH